MKKTRIDNFAGPWRFLSNFYPAVVSLDGWDFPTVEHAYQAAKTLDTAEVAAIHEAPTPGAAKKLGRSVTLRPGWEGVKERVMLNLLRQKFSDSELGAALLATGDAQLVEGNTWGDVYWGVCRNFGANRLGEMLMFVRAELSKAASVPASTEAAQERGEREG
jgi:ribA/ribD-fused uncharacterized protein